MKRIRELESVRHDLLLARAMQSLVHHHGWAQLVDHWQKQRDALLYKIVHNMRSDVLELGQWTGELRVMENLLHIAKDTVEKIPRLEEELELAIKNEAIPKFNAVNRNIPQPTWGTENGV